MGIYVNPGNRLFEEAVHSPIYVDKSGLIDYTNSRYNTEKKYLRQPSTAFWQVDGGRYAGGILQQGL